MRRLAGIVVLLLTASLLGAPAPAQALTPSSTPNSLTTSPDVETKIVGTVRDIAGQPIAGACVDAHPSQWVYVAHACTDTAGRYEIHDVVPDYSYRLEVTAVGFASRWWPQGLDYLDGTGVFPAAGTTAVADIVLPATADATGTMTGTILRQDGVPASSALVRVNTGGTWTASTYTGPDGRYQLDRLSAGAYIVQVSGAGYAAQFVPGQTAQSSAQPQIVTAGATTVVDETFRARTPAPNVLAGKVSGTVHDPAGNPVAGASIVAYSGSSIFMSDSVYGKTLTDQDGHYVLTGPLQGLPTIYVRTTAPGYATAWNTGGVRPAPAFLLTNTVKDVVLRPGVGAITGTLRDFDGGVPPRTGLSFTTLDQTLTFGTVSWFDGHFEIPNVPAGQYRLTLQPSSRPVQYWPGATDQTQGAVVTVTDGTTTDLQETLISPARFEVTVLDDVTGQPLTGACVKSTLTLTTTWTACAPAIAAGVYAYESPSLGTTSFTGITAAHDPDHLPATTGPVSADLGQTTRVTLRLSPAAMAGLDLTVPAGAAMPTQICFRAVTTVPFQPEELTAGCRPVTSGRVVLGPLRPGPVQIFLYAPTGATSLGAQWVTDAGGGGDQRQATMFTLTPGQITSGPPQHLLPSGGISGVVTGPGADTSAVCPGPIFNTGFDSGAECVTGSYIQYGLGPYRWPISLTTARVTVGWSGSGTNRFNAAYVQVVSGQATSADIALLPVSPIGLTVTGVPAGTWTLTAYDPVTGDQVSSAAGAASILVTGQVVLRLSAPSLTQPCYVGIPHAAAPGRRAQPAYVIDPVAQLTITPGGNCLSTTTPSLQAGQVTRR